MDGVRTVVNGVLLTALPVYKYKYQASSTCLLMFTANFSADKQRVKSLRFTSVLGLERLKKNTHCFNMMKVQSLTHLSVAAPVHHWTVSGQGNNLCH